MSDFITTGLRVEVVVASRRYQVSMLQMSYGLNSFPTAVVAVPAGIATGVDTAEDETPESSAEATLEKLKTGAFAKVYFAAISGVTSDTLGDGLDFFRTAPYGPDGSSGIFEGVVAGVGFQRRNNMAEYLIHLRYGLASLNDASAANPNTHPETVGQWTYPAAFLPPSVDPGDPGALSAAPEWLHIAGPGTITEADLTDIWEKVLRKHAIGITTQDYLLSSDLLGLLGIEAPVTAEGLTERAAKIKAALLKVRSAVPLTLRTDAVDASVIKRAFEQSVRTSTLDSWRFTTLWGKMVGEWSPHYMLGFAPRLHDILVFPLVPALRDDYWVYLSPDDYMSGRIFMTTHQTLRAVAIPASGGTATGYDGNARDMTESRGTLAGRFAPETVTDGVVWVKQPPPWLRDFLQLADYGATASGTSAVTGTSMDDETDPAEAPGTVPDPTTIMDTWRSVVDRFCETVYVSEVLKARTGELVTKLRFDICPGSTIRFQSSRRIAVVGTTAATMPGPEDFESVAIPLPDESVTYCAMVTQVGYVIDSNGPTVQTVLQLAHIRTLKENDEEAGKSVASPPLYENAWAGDVLIPGVKREPPRT